MWCYLSNLECYQPTCIGCCHANQNYPIYYNPSPQFNYECPDCHGRFNFPSINGCAGYICPFCNRKMEGYK